MKKAFAVVGIVIGVLLIFWLTIGFLSHLGKPYVKVNENEIEIWKNAWPNVFGENFIYGFSTSSRESLFISSTFYNNTKYYSSPRGKTIDYISIKKSGKKITLSYDDKNANSEMFLEADKKFNLIKKELKVDELLKDLVR